MIALPSASHSMMALPSWESPSGFLAEALVLAGLGLALRLAWLAIREPVRASPPRPVRIPPQVRKRSLYPRTRAAHLHLVRRLGATRPPIASRASGAGQASSSGLGSIARAVVRSVSRAGSLSKWTQPNSAPVSKVAPRSSTSQ